MSIEVRESLRITQPVSKSSISLSNILTKSSGLSSFSIYLSTMSAMLFDYQQYLSSAVVYLLAVGLDLVDRITDILTDYKFGLKLITDIIMKRLSSTVIIGFLITSQGISPVPGLIIALYMILLAYSKFKSNHNSIRLA